jgi:hypothetical protein
MTHNAQTALLIGNTSQGCTCPIRQESALTYYRSTVNMETVIAVAWRHGSVPYFSAPDDGRVGRNTQCSDEFHNCLILNLDIVTWWTENN